MPSIFDLLKITEEAANLIVSGLNSGLSGAKIGASLRSADVGIGTSKLYTAINYLKGLATAPEEYVKSIADRELPLIDKLPMTATKTLRNFTYEVSVFGDLRSTKEKAVTYVTVSTDRLLTKEEAKFAATGMLEGRQDRYGGESEVGEVTNIRQNSAGVEFGPSLQDLQDMGF